MTRTDAASEAESVFMDFLVIQGDFDALRFEFPDAAEQPQGTNLGHMAEKDAYSELDHI